MHGDRCTGGAQQLFAYLRGQPREGAWDHGVQSIQQPRRSSCMLCFGWVPSAELSTLLAAAPPVG